MRDPARHSLETNDGPHQKNRAAGYGVGFPTAYMSEIFGAGMKSQSEILNAVHRVRGFVDAAAQFKGLSAHDFEAMQRQIMAFALLYEERLDPQPLSRGLYLV